MNQPEQKFTSPASLAIDAVLVIAFFAFMFSLISPHVPTNDPKMSLLWGAICSSCLTGVFWLCVQMFRVVLRKQRAMRQR